RTLLSDTMADRVIFQNDDALSEQNLSQQRARENSTDYVERGLDVTADWAAGEVDVAAGHAVVKDGVNAYDVFPDARANVALADGSGVNYVWLVVDPSQQDDVSITVNTTGSAPSSASVLVAEVDAGAEAVVAKNQAPDATFRSAEAQSFSTDELSDVARFIEAGTSLSDINDELTQPGTVVFEAGNHFVPDWIEIGTSDITIIVEEGAHIKFEDSASPTLYSDTQNTDHTFLLYSDGYDNVTIINRGIIEGNSTNHPSPQAVTFFGGGHPTYLQEGGDLRDANAGVLFVDNESPFSLGASSTTLDDNGATIIAEGLRGGRLIGTHGANGQEAVDLNARCTDVYLAGTTGRNLNDSLIDLNEAPRTEIEGVIALGDATVAKHLNVSGGSGNRYTSRSAIGNSNDITATGLAGKVSGRGIDKSGSDPIQNLTVEGRITSTGGNAVGLFGAENQFDGLTLRGTFETEAENPAVNLGFDAQQVGLTLDAEAISAGDGFHITDWAIIRGSVRADNCGGDGVVIEENAANADNNTLFVSTVGNDGDGVVVTGSVNQTSLFGVAHANTNDLNIGASATDIEWWGWHDSLNYGGTRTLINGIGRNDGDPSSSGEWNGSGREGVKVFDTTGSSKYWYVNGNWV
ncbi:hypothetical protein, partial [Halorussus marinus]|uniref:hypothetical protein n=1 Tax=Halorussus marinus TaxID=2505976 RepID=UPI001B2FF61F